MANTTGIVNIHGKEYATVAFRLQQFRAKYPLGSIITTLVSDGEGVIVMRTDVYINTTPDTTLPIATGWAEEVRGSSNINKTSALENCETSAVGRALGFAGFGSAEQIASADEVTVAIARQKKGNNKLTKKQQKALEGHLDECTDGDIKLQKVLDYYKIDNLSEMSKTDASEALQKLEITV